jgi:hypothetical protein
MSMAARVLPAMILVLGLVILSTGVVYADPVPPPPGAPTSVELVSVEGTSSAVFPLAELALVAFLALTFLLVLGRRLAYESL